MVWNRMQMVSITMFILREWRAIKGSDIWKSLLEFDSLSVTSGYIGTGADDSCWTFKLQWDVFVFQIALEC